MGELKVDECDAKAENECFYNMYGKAIKLATNVLSKGKVVKLVTMYGIVVAVHNHEAQLLKLKIDFFEGTSTFERCRRFRT